MPRRSCGLHCLGDGSSGCSTWRQEAETLTKTEWGGGAGNLERGKVLKYSSRLWESEWTDPGF